MSNVIFIRSVIITQKPFAQCWGFSHRTGYVWATFNIYQDIISIALHKIPRDAHSPCGHRTPRIKYGTNKWGKTIVDLKQSRLSTHIQCNVKILSVAQIAIALLVLNLFGWYIWFCCISRIDKNITDWKVYHFFRHPVWKCNMTWEQNTSNTIHTRFALRCIVWCANVTYVTFWKYHTTSITLWCMTCLSPLGI